MFNKLKTKINVFLGREYYFKIQTKCSKQWFGDSYGGFYVANKTLNKDSIIYSFGVGEDISFDEALINTFGCVVFGFDPTPKSVKWIKNKNIPNNYHFLDYGINIKDGMVPFYPPENSDHVSCSIIDKGTTREQCFNVPMKSFTTITKELGHLNINVLKLDIEGAEYTVIPDILNSRVHIGQILVEFHHRFIKDGIEKTHNIVKLLNDHSYKIFAVSDSGEEVSFIAS